MMGNKLTSIFNNIKQDRRVNDSIYDDDGFKFIAMSQQTNYVWLAFRLNDTPKVAGDNTETPANAIKYRVLRLDPNESERFGVSRQTGRMERQRQFTGCQYILADVVLESVNPSANIGHVLNRIQSQFHRMTNNPIDNGMVRDGGQLQRLCERYVSGDVE